jgi:hypothetical protein
VVFAAVACVIAIGSFAADLRFPDFLGPLGILFAALPLLSFTEAVRDTVPPASAGVWLRR